MSEYDPAADAQKHFEQMQQSLEAYKEKLFSRFQDYVLGMAVLPKRDPNALPDELKQQYDPNGVSTLILLDDSETKRLSKQELKEKLSGIFTEQAKEIDENIKPEILLLSELWELCMDAKYDVLQDIALSQIFYDVGMLQAIKLAELHKQMVLKKFEKYIVAYVLGGSLVQGTATTKSDVDVFIVIDDTDVKKMTRAELRDKLRAIIIDMGYQAGEITGIQNKINIQVYILTDFWDNIKEANPVIFTFLRDGIPFYDRGIFMPWKQLLEMGKVKPSQEAIDQFMTYGDQYLKRVKVKLKEIGVDDFFWATVTPSQAAIMMLGHAPPTPKELCSVMRELFVKENLLEKKHVDNLEYILKTRKAIEHGDKADVTGKDIDDLYEKAEAYIKRLNKLFEEIQEDKDKEVVLHTYENAVTLVRDVLQAEGHSVKDADLIEVFEQELVAAGNIPQKFIRILKNIHEAKEKFDTNELSRTEAADMQKDGREFFKYLLEYLQRKRGSDLERAKIRVKHQETIGEMLFIGDTAHIVYDVAAENKEYQKLTKTKTGWSKPKDSNIEEYEQAVSQADNVESISVDAELFATISSVFGKDAEILLL
jgi:predicted nucleotidyltransferase/uncharacterized protein (UPF0332 family)